MKRIATLAQELSDELEAAKEYAEKYLDFKAVEQTQWAGKFQEMAKDELKHAGHLHDLVVEEIEKLKKIYTPPEEMMEKWQKEHREYIEKAAWIKQILQM